MFTAAFLLCIRDQCQPIRHWRRFETRAECTEWARTEAAIAEMRAAALGRMVRASGGCVGKRTDG